MYIIGVKASKRYFSTYLHEPSVLVAQSMHMDIDAEEILDLVTQTPGAILDWGVHILMLK